MPLTEDQAREQAIRTTKYCYALATAWEGEEKDSVCLERIFTKGRREEIRLAWWTDGRMANRPADIDAVDWVRLFSTAVDEGVFTAEEKLGMLKALLK